MGTMKSRKLRVFTDNDINKVADTYHSWRNNSSGETDSFPIYKNIPGFCYAAKIEEVQKQDHKLTPGIYVGTEAVEDDGIPFEEKMATLKAQLQEQFKKGNVLQQQIMENFDKF